MRPMTALLADALCWGGATIALLYYQLPVIAALVGAAGLVYMYRALQRYYQAQTEVSSPDEVKRYLDTLHRTTGDDFVFLSNRQTLIIQELLIAGDNERALELLHQLHAHQQGYNVPVQLDLFDGDRFADFIGDDDVVAK